jgi:hypothetical protein
MKAEEKILIDIIVENYSLCDSLYDSLDGGNNVELEIHVLDQKLLNNWDFITTIEQIIKKFNIPNIQVSVDSDDTINIYLKLNFGEDMIKVYEIVGDIKSIDLDKLPVYLVQSSISEYLGTENKYYFVIMDIDRRITAKTCNEINELIKSFKGTPSGEGIETHNYEIPDHFKVRFETYEAAYYFRESLKLIEGCY